MGKVISITLTLKEFIILLRHFTFFLWAKHFHSYLPPTDEEKIIKDIKKFLWARKLIKHGSFELPVSSPLELIDTLAEIEKEGK